MKRNLKILVLTGTHVFAIGIGFALGIYMLPILTAPDSPGLEQVKTVAESALFRGTFRRDLQDSDAFHWGEGELYINKDAIVLQGSLAPGPDYRLYLSPRFVETEADFNSLKSEMVQAGHVKTFENFKLDVPGTINPADFNAAIVWCESFGQFITAASYK